MPRTRRLAWSRLSAGLLLLLGLALVPASPAAAALPAPTGLTSTGAAIPTLSWDHVLGASRYTVEISTSTNPADNIFAPVSTVNRHYVPTSALPWPESGLLHWRVTPYDTAAGEPSAWQELSNTNAYPAPVIVAPTSPTTFSQPDNPVTISWRPVHGAVEYEVRISSDPDFVDQSRITTTKTVSTTYVVPNPQVATDYWFKVRARISGSGSSAVYTKDSQPIRYSVSDLPAAERVRPADDSTVVDDAVFDWNPIPGAKTYDIEVARDQEFATIVHSRTGITGTSYARPAALNDASYWWRVRAVDVANNTQQWSTRPKWQFRREWSDMVKPVYPANPQDLVTPSDTDLGVVVGDPFYYEWQPVRFASGYKIELSSDGSFNTIAGTCFSRNTTFTPSAQAAGMPRCMPAAEGTYWWRVTALDQWASALWDEAKYPRTSQVTAAFFDARFTYSPPRVMMTSPAPGATVQVPTLRWEVQANAAKYRVTITGPTSVSPITTAATSYTPVATLAPGTYSWDVVGISELGDVGSSNLLPRTFTVEAAPAPVLTSPQLVAPMSGTFSRVPSLSWEPVVGAKSYEVWIRTGGGTGWTTLPKTEYTAYTPITTDWLNAGTYDWTVAPLDANGARMTAPPTPAQFTIVAPGSVAGQETALSMAGRDAGDTCTGFACTDLRQTPVLRWDPAADAGHYQVWVSYSGALNNLVPASVLGTLTNPFTVSGTAWTPAKALPDATAGLAYHWVVVPCTAESVCAQVPAPTDSFNKASHPVVTNAPGVPYVDNAPVGTPPVVQDDVTLSWTDYLHTNQTAAPGATALDSAPTQEAREYEVQVAADPTFATLLDSEAVDQRKFTSYAATYPEGAIYWRVRAIDGNGNLLPWSTTRTFVKKSPVPTLNAIPDTTNGTPVFSWAPLAYAASYRIEIYPAGSNTPVYAAPVSSNQVKWSPTTTTHLLAPGNYEWRVQRVDAKGRYGDWSARSPFTVKETVPTLVSPTNGQAVQPRDSVMTWDAVADAADYRLELMSPTGATTAVITKATSWAPTAKLTVGTWTWRVQPRNSKAGPIGTSANGTFVVGEELAATVAPRFDSDSTGKVDTVVRAIAAEWNLAPDAVAYTWYIGGIAKIVPDDGSLSYQVVPEDRGKTIEVWATARKAGYTDATSKSARLTAVIGDGPTASSLPRIEGSGRVGELLTGIEPTWEQPDAESITPKWLVNGTQVGTGLTYTPTAGQVGKDIVFEVVGSRDANYAKTTVASAPLTIQAGSALQVVDQPTVSGTFAPGQYVRATPGTWTAARTSFAYQWLRNGQPITGATAGSYRLTAADAAQRVSVRVQASATGYEPGTAVSNAVLVAKNTSTTSLLLRPNPVKPSRRAKAVITVTVPGMTGPTGVVLVKKGRKTLVKFTLFAGNLGKRTVKLPRLKVGSHKIKVVYQGNTTTTKSVSKVVVLSVKR